MPICPHCHCRFKGLKNHLSQGICRSVNNSVTSQASPPVASISPNLPSVRERESSDFLNPSNDFHECSPTEKWLRHTETGVHTGSEIEFSFNLHDDLSEYMPNSIVNQLLDSQLELDVIPESDEVDKMFQFDIKS